MGSYFESLDSDLVLEPTPIGVSFSTLEYTHGGFLDNIRNHVFSPTKIKSIIESNIHLYFSYQGFTDPRTRSNMQQIWTNIDFLSNVLALLNENPKFHQKVVTAYQRDINIIASDYLSTTSEGIEQYRKDPKVPDILFEIACSVNAEYIVQLSSNIDVRSAKLICLKYFGTFNLPQAKCNIIRYLWESACNGTVFSIEQIIYVLYVFFKDNFGDAFTTLMMYRNFDSSNEKIKMVEDNISSALINILNSMSSIEIREVLSKYANYIAFMSDKNRRVRFSLKHLPAAFKNIADSVVAAEQAGYYIP